ncbi:MAG: glycosyltransferase [Endomicrobium sp.]|jgi:glycosyltransferase involved in cell wall biosynthesis|nr:glycosyltransferase [Endomicrobium sp.]
MINRKINRRKNLFISVIIPTCNKSKFLDVTLASLSKQKLSKEDGFEIVVVNDGKEKETKEVVNSWKTKLNKFSDAAMPQNLRQGRALGFLETPLSGKEF